MTEKPVGIYVHLPFCASRCAYCDFCSTADRADLIPAYQAALLRHLEEFAPRLAGYLADAVYFGGGTPSWYGAKNLVKLFDTMKRRFRVPVDGEVTLEANPDSITLPDFQLLRKAGFNRVSIGVQSANDAILRFLGRRHSWSQAVAAVDTVRAAGFENVSLDLMYGLPAQTREDWADTLHRVIALEPEHLSCYGLKLEEGTPLWQYRNSPSLPDEDTQADMYLYTVETLAAAGYIQYEISNFARKGYASRHNMKYWTLGEYAAFGASAASYMGNRRYTYLPDPEGYIDAIQRGGELVSEMEDVSLYEQASEYVMLGMRTAQGIEPAVYESRYHHSFAPLEALLQGYVKLGLAKLVGTRWRFTPQGFLLSNRLIGELLDAQAEQKYHSGIPWRKDDYYGVLF